MKTDPNSRDNRIQRRKRLQLRVDARLISEQERIDILAGMGHPDLETEGLALSRPRHGMHRMETRDVSVSGLRLAVEGLPVEPGSAMTLDVHLPGDQRVVKLLSDVIWSADLEGRVMAGLRFAALEIEGLARLQRALREAGAD